MNSLKDFLIGSNRTKAKTFSDIQDAVDALNTGAARVTAEALGGGDEEAEVPALATRDKQTAAMMSQAQASTMKEKGVLRTGKAQGRRGFPTESPQKSDDAVARSSRWRAGKAVAQQIQVGDDKTVGGEDEVSYKYIQWGGSQKSKIAGVHPLVVC